MLYYNQLSADLLKQEGSTVCLFPFFSLNTPSYVHGEGINPYFLYSPLKPAMFSFETAGMYHDELVSTSTLCAPRGS